MQASSNDEKVQDRLLAPPPNRRFRISLLLEVPAVFVAILMMLHITLNAILRTFFSAPIDYTIEITQYWYMPLIAFLGFIAAQIRGEHIKADFIFNHIPDVTKKYLQGISYLVIAIISFFFAWYGWGEAMKAFSVLRTAGASLLPAWPAYFLAPFAFAVLTVQFAITALRFLQGKNNSDDQNASDDVDAEEMVLRGE